MDSSLSSRSDSISQFSLTAALAAAMLWLVRKRCNAASRLRGISRSRSSIGKSYSGWANVSVSSGNILWPDLTFSKGNLSSWFSRFENLAF